MPTRAQRLASEIGQQTGDPDAAVAWVHGTAWVRHAVTAGLIAEPVTVKAGVQALAGSHPRLAPLADPAVNPLWRTDMPAGYTDAVESVTVGVTDRPYRTDGHALGNLYQELSEPARKQRALCQTPKFVTDLLLDLAVNPAVEDHGCGTTVIDPACGTGHILTEALIRLLVQRPGGSRAPYTYITMEECLDRVYGVDLDPYAATLAAYRLLALTCRANASLATLADRADLPVHVACADALLGNDPILARGRYHAVVGNPPYITAKDSVANAAIRAAYPRVCHRKYSLAVPFFQLMTELLVSGGWCAQLTANSFMKREFGTKFVEQYLPGLDLRWVIDTSGAYIPGHGTPTVILVHRNQPPSSDTVNTVLGIRGEPSTPDDPARGKVWTAIAGAVRTKLSYRRLADGLARAELSTPVPTAPTAPTSEPGTRWQQPSLLDILKETAR